MSEAANPTELVTVVTREPSGKPVIHLNGEVDVCTSAKLSSTISQLIDEGNYHIVIDMRGVLYIDSTGVKVLASAIKRLGEHEGTITLADVHDRVSKTLKITGLWEIFNIQASSGETPG